MGGGLACEGTEEESAIPPRLFSSFAPDGQLARVGIRYLRIAAEMDTVQMSMDNWIEAARSIAAVYAEHDGFVVWHPKATLATGASVLSFILEGLNKPVVVTGAMMPFGVMYSDAHITLVKAVTLAARLESELPRICEVVVVFGGRILRACRTTRSAQKRFEDFESPGFPTLGSFGEFITVRADLFLPAQQQLNRLHVNEALCRKV